MVTPTRSFFMPDTVSIPAVTATQSASYALSMEPENGDARYFLIRFDAKARRTPAGRSTPRTGSCAGPSHTTASYDRSALPTALLMAPFAELRPVRRKLGENALIVVRFALPFGHHVGGFELDAIGVKQFSALTYHALVLARRTASRTVGPIAFDGVIGRLA